MRGHLPLLVVAVALPTSCAWVGTKEIDPVFGVNACVPADDQTVLLAAGRAVLDESERWEDLQVELSGERADDVRVGVVPHDEIGAGSAIAIDDVSGIEFADPLGLDGPGIWSIVLVVDTDDRPFAVSAEHVTYRSGGRLHRSDEADGGVIFEAAADGRCDGDERDEGD